MTSYIGIAVCAGEFVLRMSIIAELLRTKRRSLQLDYNYQQYRLHQVLSTTVTVALALADTATATASATATIASASPSRVGSNGSALVGVVRGPWTRVEGGGRTERLDDRRAASASGNRAIQPGLVHCLALSASWPANTTVKARPTGRSLVGDHRSVHCCKPVGSAVESVRFVLTSRPYCVTVGVCVISPLPSAALPACYQLVADQSCRAHYYRSPERAPP